jgi:hypothetical protein
LALLGNDEALAVGSYQFAHPHAPGLALASSGHKLLLDPL